MPICGAVVTSEGCGNNDDAITVLKKLSGSDWVGDKVSAPLNSAIEDLKEGTKMLAGLQDLIASHTSQR